MDKNLIQLAQLLFGEQLPYWAARALTIVLYAGMLSTILLSLERVATVAKLYIVPLFYSREERRRCNDRRLLARLLEYRLMSANRCERWSDARYIDLEAQVVIDARIRGPFRIPAWLSARSGLRKERSLSRALEKSKDRLILLEGAPGSGKSTALRHVALSLATRACKSSSSRSVIPVYVNLRELERQPETPIDSTLIREFVIESLVSGGTDEVEKFVSAEFDVGARRGTWLFLFDSFDEIPDVLSTSEDSDTIQDYSEAISLFLHSMSKCRGVVGSREFRGPRRLRLWTVFRIAPLSWAQTRKLARKVWHDEKKISLFLRQLSESSTDIRSEARNPMFLTLLCEYVHDKQQFPVVSHDVYGSFLRRRLDADESRLALRFRLTPEQLQAGAEKVAFAMTATSELGLSPLRAEIEQALVRLDIQIPGGSLAGILDALEFTRLARSELFEEPGRPRRFAFNHRRFQEYFATRVLLDASAVIPPRQLLTEDRWRESAVVLCQTLPPDQLSGILAAAEKTVVEARKQLRAQVRRSAVRGKGKPLDWPEHTLHILALLQSGFRGRLTVLPDSLRVRVGKLIRFMATYGGPIARGDGLSVAGIAPNAMLIPQLASALTSRIQWLRESAFRQTSLLAEIPPLLAREIRRMFVDRLFGGDLHKEWTSTSALITGSSHEKSFRNVLWTLRLLLPFDLICATTYSALIPRLVASMFPGSVIQLIMVILPLISGIFMWFLITMAYADWTLILHLRIAATATSAAIITTSFILPLGHRAPCGWALLLLLLLMSAPIIVMQLKLGESVHPWQLLYSAPQAVFLVCISRLRLFLQTRRIERLLLWMRQVAPAIPQVLLSFGTVVLATALATALGYGFAHYLWPISGVHYALVALIWTVVGVLLIILTVAGIRRVPDIRRLVQLRALCRQRLKMKDILSLLAGIGSSRLRMLGLRMVAASDCLPPVDANIQELQLQAAILASRARVRPTRATGNGRKTRVKQISDVVPHERTDQTIDTLCRWQERLRQQRREPASERETLRSAG